jgi:hypothetical protein
LGNPRERDHLEDPVVYGRKIIRWIFRKWDVMVRTGSIWLRIETGGLLWKHCNDPSGSMKCGEFLD